MMPATRCLPHRLLLLFILWPLSFTLSAADSDTAVLAQEISDLKEQMIQLNRDLFILQEELLFPAETQLAVFLSTDSGVFFRIDSVELRLNDQPVTHYLYTEHEQQALARGGVQRLWTGNIKQGEHELVAFCQGIDPQGRNIEQAAAVNFSKSDDEAALLEIRIIDNSADMRAHIRIEPWQQ